jgi:hypothetical protein
MTGYFILIIMEKREKVKEEVRKCERKNNVRIGGNHDIRTGTR